MLCRKIICGHGLQLPNALFMQTKALSVKSSFLQFGEFGEPHKVVQKHDVQLDSSQVKETDVLVKMLVAPINPADINIIQGKYGESPKLPFIPGNEGVAEVLECGKNVKHFQAGDRVIPFASLLGTWRTHAIFPVENLYKVPKDVRDVDAATITVNPSTAFRMLRDFIELKPGDTVIQNGGNSAVGQAVIQLCRIWNIRSVNVVRDRPNINELKNTLKSLGASEILTEEEIRTTTLFKSGALPVPKLALNCVGGKSATNVTRHLAAKGVLVTYGAMSREPLTIPNSALIFKDIAFRGFWMSKWSKEQSAEARHQMYEELFQLMASGQFKPPMHRLVPLSQYKDALEQLANVNGMTGEKILFDFIK